MSIGLKCRKVGMTRVFTEQGKSIPVTVLQVNRHNVTQIKSVETDGYDAVQLTAGHKKQSHVSKPMAGHFAKAKTEPGYVCFENRINGSEYELGQEIKLEEVFNAGDIVDVTGTSKGKGFAGVVKRWNFKTQDATHGNSLSHRAPGSIGQNQTPGRVFKGKKMAGQMGNVKCTTQNLELVKIDNERNLLLIKGAVPGAPGSDVLVKSAKKKVSK